MQRGPYKKYLRHDNLPILESTIRSRRGDEAQGQNEHPEDDRNVHDGVGDLQNIDEVKMLYTICISDGTYWERK